MQLRNFEVNCKIRPLCSSGKLAEPVAANKPKDRPRMVFQNR
jgi:hypothetical protein